MSERDPKLRHMQQQAERLLSGGPEGPGDDDPIERWGKRIGRGLSIVLSMGLLWYLWSTLGR
jgi:hypothetical protein